jgi:hypothetical protein
MSAATIAAVYVVSDDFSLTAVPEAEIDFFFFIRGVLPSDAGAMRAVRDCALTQDAGRRTQLSNDSRLRQLQHLSRQRRSAVAEKDIALANVQGASAN